MRTPVLGALGVASTAVAAAFVFAPEAIPEQLSAVVSMVESQDPKRLLLALGSAVGLYAAWAARSGSDERTPRMGPATRFGDDDPPETVSAAGRARTGERFDTRVAAAVDGDDRALGKVRSTLAETATGAYASASDSSPTEARRAVETGAWTDDELAAAFLGDPGFPLLARLRAWLDPEAERKRRVERAVAAVESALDAEGPGTSATDGGTADGSTADEAATGGDAE